MTFTTKERKYLKLKKFGKHPKNEKDEWNDLNYKWVEWMRKINDVGKFRDFIINEAGEIELYDIN